MISGLIAQIWPNGQNMISYQPVVFVPTIVLESLLELNSSQLEQDYIYLVVAFLTLTSVLCGFSILKLINFIKFEHLALTSHQIFFTLLLFGTIIMTKIIFTYSVVSNICLEHKIHFIDFR